MALLYIDDTEAVSVVPMVLDTCSDTEEVMLIPMELLGDPDVVTDVVSPEVCETVGDAVNASENVICCDEDHDTDADLDEVVVPVCEGIPERVSVSEVVAVTDPLEVCDAVWV